MNWKKFISQYDLIYNRPPQCWQDGLVIGNGNLGAIMFAPDALHFLVNKVDTIDGRVTKVKKTIPFPEAREMIKNGFSTHDFRKEEVEIPPPQSAGPKTCCELIMELASYEVTTAMPAVKSRLSLYHAGIETAVDKHLCHPRVNSFVDTNSNTLLIKVRDISVMAGYKNRLFFSKPEDIEIPSPELFIEKERLFLKNELPENGYYVVGMQIIPQPTTAYVEERKKLLREEYQKTKGSSVKMELHGKYGMIMTEGNFDIHLTVVSSRETDDPVKQVHENLDCTIKSGIDDIRERHNSWWEKFWQKSWLEVGNKAYEQLYYHSLYHLGSSYRHAPMPGLSALFYGPSYGPLQHAPWHGNLTTDLNVQCPFFGVFTANHSELANAYMESFNSFLPEAERLALEVFGFSGAQFDVAFNVIGRSQQQGVGNYRFYYGGSYIGLIYCFAWRFTRDKKLLKEFIHPFLAKIVEFYQGIIETGEDGKYHFWPAHACELDVADCGDPVQVVSMLKICLITLLETAELLNIDSKAIETWQDFLEKLPDYPIDTDAKGREVVVDGVGIPGNHHVGQAGCIHPIYPCGEIDEFSADKEQELYQRTFASVLEKTAETYYSDDGCFHYRDVWQCFYRAMTALRLGDVEKFHDLIRMFLSSYVKPNAMIAHDAARVITPEVSEANLDLIPRETLDDRCTKMPKTEAWHDSIGTASPDPRCKEFAKPFIEGSGDWVTIMSEMLLQSHNGIIRVFPGLKAQGKAQFVGLLAEGNINISSKICNGEVEFIKIVRTQTETNCPIKNIKIKSPWTGKIEKYSLSESDMIVLTEKGITDICPEQEPEIDDTPEIRVIYEDRFNSLKLGKE